MYRGATSPRSSLAGTSCRDARPQIERRRPRLDTGIARAGSCSSTRRPANRGRQITCDGRRDSNSRGGANAWKTSSGRYRNDIAISNVEFRLSKRDNLILKVVYHVSAPQKSVAEDDRAAERLVYGINAKIARLRAVRESDTGVDD